MPACTMTDDGSTTDPKSAERHIICELRCAPADRDRVRQLLLRFVDPARQEAGCLYYDLYEKSAQPGTFYILDGWEDQAAVAAHAADPHVAIVTQELGPLLVYGPHITMTDRVSDQAAANDKAPGSGAPLDHRQVQVVFADL